MLHFYFYNKSFNKSSDLILYDSMFNFSKRGYPVSDENSKKGCCTEYGYLRVELLGEPYLYEYSYWV